MAVHLPIEMVFDADVDGVYEAVVPSSRIRQVSGQFGIKNLRVHLSDNARAAVEIINGDGAYTAPAGLRSGVWAKLRVVGTHELLFTGRIEELTPNYTADQPYVRLTLSTMRNDLTVPTQSVLLKNTNVKDATIALLADVPLASAGGYWMLGHSKLDTEAKLYGSGANPGDGLPVSAYLRFYGTTWKALAAAGGYGAREGDLDVLGALAEMMKAEDGRAVWGRDNYLEVYSQTWLDAARTGTIALTLTDGEVTNAAFGNGTFYTNDVRLTWYPRRWQANVALWTFSPTSAVSLAPSATRDWNVRFKHDDSDRVVAAENVTVTLSASGDGLRWEWAGELKATGGTLRVTNYDATGIDLTGIDITGTALLFNDQVEIRERNEWDISRFGLTTLMLDCALIDNQTVAAARAVRELAAFGDAWSYASRIELRPRTGVDAIAWMTLPFGTLMRLDSDRMGHDAEYLLIGCDWSVNEGARLVDITLYLEPARVGGA